MGETDWGGNWVLFWWVKPCSVNLSSNLLLMGGAVSFLWLHLTPNYDGDYEDNGDLQKVPCTHCCTQCLRPWSRPLPTHTSAEHSWTYMGMSESVCCGVTAPFSWVLVHTGFVCALQESVSPALCNFWWFYGGVNGNLLQESLCHSQACCIQSPCPCGRPLLTHTSAGDTQTFKGRTDSLDGFSGCTQGFVWALQAYLAGMGFDSKCNFALPTILLGLLLCPWMWGIFLWWWCWWLFSSKL